MDNTIIPKTMYAGQRKKPMGPLRKIAKVAKKMVTGKPKVPVAAPGNNLNMIGDKPMAKKAMPKAKKKAADTSFRAYLKTPKNAREMVQRRMSSSKPASVGGVYSNRRSR